MKKIAILFSGEGTNMQYLLEHFCQRKDIQVVLALCNNPQAKGIQKARQYGIEPLVIDHRAFETREDFDAKIVQIIQSYRVDLTVLAGFMRIVTDIFTSNINAINLHPSFLPYFKGKDAIQRSFESDMDFGGVSVHRVSNELDGGEIIVQEKIGKQNLCFAEFTQKIQLLEKRLLLQAVLSVLSLPQKSSHL